MSKPASYPQLRLVVLHDVEGQRLGVAGIAHAEFGAFENPPDVLVLQGVTYIREDWTAPVARERPSARLVGTKEGIRLLADWSLVETEECAVYRRASAWSAALVRPENFFPLEKES